jgi:putative transposase
LTINAIVLLPDHLHTIWTLPPGDVDYSGRWNWIKHEFTRLWLEGIGTESKISESRRREGRRGVWQPRFWEHTIESDEDFERHFDYLHYNPVKHGLAASPGDWKWSSFHRWVRLGVYPRDWGRSTRIADLSFADIAHTVGE